MAVQSSTVILPYQAGGQVVLVNNQGPPGATGATGPQGPPGTGGGGGGGTLVPQALQTASFAAAVDKFWPIDTTSATTVVATLPTAPADGKQVEVKVDAGPTANGLLTHPATVNLGGSDVLNVAGGSTTFQMTTLRQSVLLQYQAAGAIWHVMTGDLSLSQLQAMFAATGDPRLNVFLDRGAWAPTTAYALGDVVTYNTFRYAAKTAHTSTSTFDATKFVKLGSVEATIPALEGVSSYAYGHSYITGSGASGFRGWAQRLVSRTRIGSINNNGVNSYVMTDTCSKIATTWTVGLAGVAIVESVLNDARQGTSSQKVAGLTNAVKAAVEFLRMGTKLDNTAATYTGTWTANTGLTYAAGATSHSTTTQNDSFTLAVPGTQFTLMFFGIDDAALGTAGGTISVTVDGAAVGSFSLSNQMSNAGAVLNVKKGHYPVTVTGLGPGYHNVVVTKTDATGSLVEFDCAVAPATYPATVLLVKDGIVPGVVQATLDSYNNVLDTIAATYPLQHVIAGPVSPDWSTSVVTTDNVHPSDKGHEIILGAVVSSLSALDYRAGLGTVSLADVVTPTPTSVADTFTRADNTNVLGSTTTGAVPWSIDTSGAKFGINTNRAYSVTAVSQAGATVETGKADCTVQATLAVLGGGVRFRSDGGGNYLALLHDGNIWASTNNALSNVATTGMTLTAGDVIALVVSGSSVTLKKNGSTIGTYAVAGGQWQNYTRHGIHFHNTTTARTDDFSVA